MNHPRRRLQQLHAAWHDPPGKGSESTGGGKCIEY
jgi:hypothetical protein